MIACGTDWVSLVAVGGFFGALVLVALAFVIMAWRQEP